MDVPGAGGTTKASAVDADGYVWTTGLNANKAFKIDPATNEVVTTLDTGSYPYNYSDMTGRVRIGSTERSGTWTEIVDSQNAGKPWGNVTVESVLPESSGVAIRVRSADIRELLAATAWTTVQSSELLTDFRGRFLEVQLTLTSSEPSSTPSVQELTVAAIAPPSIVIHEPEDGAEIPAGQNVVISGSALATMQVGPQATPVPNRIAAVLIDGGAVDVVDAAGNLFTQVTVLPGENVFHFTAIDAYGQTGTATLTIVGTQAPTGNADLLFDVSPSFAPLYARTSFEERSDLLFAELAIHNVGHYPADNPLYVGVRNISDLTVSVRETAGTTRDGTPYYDFSPVVPGNSLVPEEVTGFVNAVFHNPNRVQFTYDLVFLAKLNEPPVFTTVPIVETHAGWNYRYDADATDPDGDPLTYSLLSRPPAMSVDAVTGEVTWLPAEADLGVHPVVLRVEDGRGGSAQQHYLLSVTETPPNRPPYFVSIPVTEARIATPQSTVDGRFRAGELFVASSRTDEIRVYSADTMKFVESFSHPLFSVPESDSYAFGPNGLAFNERGNLLVAAYEQFVEFDDYGVEFARYPKHFAEPTENIAFDRLGNLYTSTSTRGANHVIQYAAGDYRFRQVISLPSGAGEFTGIVFDQSDRLYVASQSNQRIYVLQGNNAFSEFAHVSSFFATGSTKSLESIQIDHNGDLLVCAGGILRFDRESQGLLKSFVAPGLIFPVPSAIDNESRIFVADWKDGAGLNTADIFRFTPGGESYVSINDPSLFGPFGMAVSGTRLPGNQWPTYAYGALAIDPDFDPIQYNLIQGPPGMDIAPATGLVTWGPTVDQIGFHPVTIEASDGRGGVAQQTYVVEVLPDAGNRPPVIISEPVTEIGLVATNELAQTMTFESILGQTPIDGMEISTQFLESHGVTFNLENGDSPVLAKVGSPRTAFEGYQGQDDEPAPGQGVGSFFLTDDGTLGGPPQPLIVSYAAPVAAAGGVILDIDGTEEWTVEVRDATGAVLDVVVLDENSPPGPGDALAFPWSFTRPQADISSIRLVYTGAQTSGVGLAFDNFTPTTAGQEYQYDVVAIDPDNDPLDYALLSEPEGMQIDATSGLVRWPVTAEDIGPHPVVVQVSDGRGGFDVQNFNVNVLAGTGIIQGAKFNDLDGDGVWHSNDEPGLSDWTVYLDQNRNGRRDVGEPWTVTNENGEYSFTGLPAGTYYVAEELRPGWVQTSPAELGGELIVNGSFEDSPISTIRWGLPVGDTSITGWTVVKDKIDYVIVEDEVAWQASDGTRWLDLGGNPGAGGISQIVPTRAGSLYRVSLDLSGNPDPNTYGGDDGPAKVLRVQAAGQAADFVFDVDVEGNTIYDMKWRSREFTFVATGDQTEIQFLNVMDEDYSAVYRGPALDNVSVQAAKMFGVHEVVLAMGETAYDVNFGNVESDPGNESPVFSGTPLTTATAHSLYRYDAVAHDPDNDPLTFDLPLGPAGMAVHPELGVLVWQPTRDQVGSHQVVLRVQDDRGGLDLQSFTITVAAANTPPVITSSPPSLAVVDVPLQYQVRAQDADGDLLTFGLENAPLGIAIGEDTGLLTWMATGDQLGSHTFTILGSDGRGGEAQQAVTLEVVATAPNDPPVITSEPRLRARVGQLYGYLVEASDPNGDPLSFHLDAAPTGMTVDNAGAVSWVAPSDLLGTTQPVSIRVEDGRGGSATQQFDLEVVSQDSNQPPWITSTPLLTGVVGRTYQYQLAARDPEGDPVTWSLDTAPAGMSIDPLRGTIRWTPAADQTGSHPVVVRVQDIAYAASAQWFTIDVRAVNLPPTIQSTPPVLANVDELYAYAVRAIDPDGDSLTFSLAAKPDGMMIDARTGLVRWTPAAAAVGQHTVRVVVEDGYGGIGSQTYTLNVGQQPFNRPPIITSTPPYYATVDRPYRYPVVARDPEGGPLAYSLDRNPAGMTIDAGTGVVTWTPTADSPPDPAVTVVAADNAGARATQSYVLSVRPNQPPQITPPAAQSVAAGASYRYDVRAVDPEGDPITFVLDTAPAGMTMDTQGRITWRPAAADIQEHTVQLTARDSYGATDTVTYSLTVTEDTEAPRVTLSASTNLASPGADVVFQINATDNVGVQSVGLTVGGAAVAVDAFGRATVQMDQGGLIDAIATAVDVAGNVGTSNTWQVRVLDPDDQDAPKVTIHSPAYDAVIPYRADVVISVEDDNLATWRVEYAPVSLVNTADIGADNPHYRLLAQGTDPVTQEVVATIDATTLANDAYFLRVVASDVNGQGWVEPLLFSVAGEAKLGNFRLEFVDLSIPLAGIPIQVQRVYDTLYAGQEGDFGYGWQLGVQDARILETVPSSHEFVPGKTRVYLTTPEGRRVGFTYQEEQVPVLVMPSGPIMQGLFGDTKYRAYFEPDPGVYETLAIDQEFVVRGGLSNMFSVLSQALGSGPLVNPNAYTLTTNDGLSYRYGQSSGLQSITDPSGNTVTFTENGIVHSSGVSIDFVRDPRGRITEIVDTAGDSIYYQYDAAHDLVGFTNQVGDTTRYVYKDTRAHFLDEIYDSTGVRVFKAKFDDAGRLTGATDALGNVVQQQFDPDALTGTITDARGHVTTLGYDERGNVTVEQSAPVVNSITGETVRYTKTYKYGDPRHPDKETKIVEYDGTIVQHEYDAVGNTTNTTRTSPDGLQAVSTAFAYDAGNNLTTLTAPNGGASIFTYTNNNVTSVTSALGDVAHATYTADGKQETFTDFNGNTTQYNYLTGCPCGTPQKVTHPDGSYELRQWNQYSQITRVEYYEADGMLVHVTTTDYDALGRKVRETVGTGADEVVTSYVYQASTENVTQQTVVHPTDPSQNRVTHYFYDAVGNVIRQVDPDLDAADPTAGIFFKYDASGNRVWLMDPIGNVTTWIYDAFDRVIEERDPLYWDGTDWASMSDAQILTVISTPTAVPAAPYGPSHITRYAYDGADNLVEQIDRNGRRRTFEYDHRGNMLAEVWYDATDDVTPIRELVFTYDTAGNMLTAADPDAEYVFTYDTMNRLETMSVDYPWATNFDTFTLTYEYDAMGNVISTTDSTGVAVKSTYDSRNQLDSRWWEGDEVDNIRADFDYTATGQLAHVDRFADKERKTSAGSSDYAYDLAGRVRQITHKNAVDDVIANYDYEFDFSGLLTKETLTHINAAYNRTADYGYDQRGQLISALYDNEQEDEWYTYDANGNRTGSYLHGTGYRTGPGNQLLSDGTFNYTYDHEGNMVTKTRITSVEGEVNYTEYAYDFRNRMTNVTQYSKHPSEGGIILNEQSNRYDSLGRRISVLVDGDGAGPNDPAVTLTVHNGENAWADFDAVGGSRACYLFGSRVDQIHAQQLAGADVSWYLTSVLHTVRDIVDSNSRRVSHVPYSGFGQPLLLSQPAFSNRFLFTAREFDPNIAFYYYRARFYDPANGTFVSEDPLRHGAGDSNLHRYVMNSPLNGHDPRGTFVITSFTIFVAMAGLSLGLALYWAHHELPKIMEQIKRGEVDCEQYRDFQAKAMFGDPPFLTYLMTYLLCRIFAGLQSVGQY